MTTYEAFKSTAIVADATSCRKSKMAAKLANEPEVVIYPKLWNISSKFQRLPPCFRGQLSNSGTSDFVGRRCVLEIQDGSKITGSSNNFAGFTDKHLHSFWNMCMTMYEISKYPAVMVNATLPHWATSLLLIVWVCLHSNFRAGLRNTRVLKQCIMALQGHPRSFILAPIESAYTTSYWSSIVTLVLSCPVSEILQDSCWERPRPYSTRILGVFPLD